jgi:hypothetical protein
MIVRPERRNKGEREIPRRVANRPASPRPAGSTRHLPPHLGQHVGHLVEQLVRLLQPARGIGAASGLELKKILLQGQMLAALDLRPPRPLRR